MKNKIILSIMMVMALMLSVGIASAAVTVIDTFSDTNPFFGSSSQKASNPNADDSADENIYVSGDINLQNNAADVTITSITISTESGFSQTDDGSSGYINITLNDSDLIVNGNTTETVTLKARIPERLNAVNSVGVAKAFKVATVTFNFNDSSSVSTDVYMQRENRLTIDKVRVTSEDEYNGKSFDDGDDIDDLKPGEEIDVEITVENEYDNNDDDVDIEDVEIVIIIDDGDLDVDEDKDIGDVDADDKETGTLSFTLDDDADDDTYDGELYVTGDDEFGARHGETWDLDWEIKRKKNELKLKTTDISPGSVSCIRQVTFTTKIQNIGSRDQDEVALYVKNSQLNIDFSREDIEIDDSDRYTKSFDATIADDVKPGTYTVRFSVYYSGDEDDGVLGDLKDVDFVVSDCSVTTTPAEEEEEEIIEVIDIAPIVTTSGGNSIVETTETSFRDSTAYTVLLILGIIAVIGIAIFLVLKFLLLMI